MANDPTLKNRIKSLLLKGFNKEEIKSLLSLTDNDDKMIAKCLKESSTDINDNSLELYSELQKDLSKLVFTEMNNKEKKDPAVILNAIKLQAELQEKKIMLSKGGKSVTKISKQYIFDRDEEIVKLKEQGVPESEIAKKYGISEGSIMWAVDRCRLQLPEHLKALSPTLICETAGLPREERLRLLEEALDKGLTKLEVRSIANEIKNKTRAKGKEEIEYVEETGN